MLATLLAEVLSLAFGVLAWVSAAPTPLFLAHLMLLVAAVTGLICLLLIPAVLRLRETPPPLAITRFAVVVSVLPIVVLAASLMWR